MPNPNCIAPDCDKLSRTGAATYCPMHYNRLYRHGRLDAQANRSGISGSNGRRYRQQRSPGHPLANKSGRVYVHRAVLYDLIGPGPHPCHWCETELDWWPRGESAPLQVDHLNAISDDNRPENLVASCPSCNTRRGSYARHDALVAAGWWSVNDTIAVLRQGGRLPRIEAAAGSSFSRCVTEGGG